LVLAGIVSFDVLTARLYVPGVVGFVTPLTTMLTPDDAGMEFGTVIVTVGVPPPAGAAATATPFTT